MIYFIFIFIWTSCFAKPLTLECAFSIALDQNPKKKAAEEGVLAQEELVLAAFSPYYPDLRGFASYRRFREFIFLPTINSPFPLSIPRVVGPVNDYTFNVYSRYIIFDNGLR